MSASDVVITDHFGQIIEASAEAAHMLDVSSPSLPNRSLLLFFLGDREAWMVALRHASQGQIMTRRGWLRPRSRRALTRGSGAVANAGRCSERCHPLEFSHARTAVSRALGPMGSEERDNA